MTIQWHHHPSTAGKLLLPKSIGRILRSRQYAAEIGRLYKYNIELKPADIRIALGNIIDRIISGKLRHIGSSRISLVLKKDLERVSRAMADKARIISKEARRMQAEAARVNEEMKKRSKEQIKWAVKRAKRERRRERRLPSGARRLDNIPTIHLKPITTNPPPLESNPPGKKPVRRRK